MKETIHIRASLAVLLIDDFTGKIITSPSLRVTAENTKKPVRKADGFWVFTNLTDETARVSVEGGSYYKENQSVALKNLDRANPVVRIRMKPDQSCVLPPGTACMTAVLPQNTSLMVYNEQGSDYKKLLVDYEKGGRAISLYQGEKEELEGKLCCIADKNNKKEFIRLGRLTDRKKGLYLLEPPLKTGYKKIGTKVYPVSSVKAREAGEYFLPLKGGLEYTCVYEHDGKTEETRIKLEPGRTGRFERD